MHPVRKGDYRARPLQCHTRHAVLTFSVRGCFKEHMDSSRPPAD